jgi:hypothetical protein
MVVDLLDPGLGILEDGHGVALLLLAGGPNLSVELHNLLFNFLESLSSPVFRILALRRRRSSFLAHSQPIRAQKLGDVQTNADVFAEKLLGKGLTG